MVPLDQEVLVLEGEVVASIRALAARGVGSKRIAAALDVARNTVKRYVRTTVPAGVQVRSQARCSSEEARAEARRVSEVATVRVETARRASSCRSILGCTSARTSGAMGSPPRFSTSGGVTRTVLGDNARALVSGRDVATSTVHFQPAYLAFCRDWDVQPRACAPYRARTKGKTESGVKYVKRNAFAGLTLPSFVALETHLATWMPLADQRIHGTTHEAPAVRFARDEPPVLRPLPQRALPRREQRVRRRVAADALVDIDTVRCSVPHPLVREHVEVAIGDDTVRLYHGGQLVATHRRHERREAGACRRALAAVAPRISGRAARRRVGRHRAHRADVSRFLDQLLQQATAAKQRKRIAMGIQIAHFPTVKTLDDFDFKFQASIDQRLVRELATGRFISQAENVLIFGPPGRRQDALAFGLGRAAVESGHAVLFTSAAALSGALAESETDGQLAERFTFHSKPKLLIIGAAARTCSSSSWRAATSAAAR